MSDISFDFSGENVLVVGGSRGIGYRVCELLLKYKAKNVYSIARSKCSLEKVNSIICDISNVSKLEKSLDDIKDEISILINVAGTNLCVGIQNIDESEWDRVLNVNLKSYFTTIRYIAPSMIKKGRGKIVNVSSIAGRSKSIVSGAHYTASKYGIIGLTKQIAQELGKYNINVNCTCPSQTMTEMLLESMSKKQINDLSEKIPLRKISDTTEQAMPILFLCSDAASYIHGAAIDVNGGQF